MSQVVTSLKLDATLRDRVKSLADKRQRKAHWVMVEAIREYVEREESRQSAWEDAMKAWENFRATGMHATEEEMEAWFDQLEAGNDVEPPACHR